MRLSRRQLNRNHMAYVEIPLLMSQRVHGEFSKDQLGYMIGIHVLFGIPPPISLVLPHFTPLLVNSSQSQSAC